MLTTNLLDMARAQRPEFLVTVDIAIFAIVGDDLSVLMIRRRDEPFQGGLALPGGFVEEGEDLADAASRELCEETGVAAAMIDQYGVYGAPGRDPRGRVVTIAHLAVLPEAVRARAGDDAADAMWVPVFPLITGRRRIAFDHKQLLRDAVDSLRGRLASTTIATAFCGEEFTLSQLRKVYEVVLGQSLDPGNFQRKMRSTEDFIADTGRTRPSPAGRGRPAAVFRSTVKGVHRLSNPMSWSD